MRHLTAIILVFLLTTVVVRAENYVFSPINVSHGLSDNQIRYILQLPDGRMVFKTSGNLNLYDGGRFTYIHQTPQSLYPLKGYDGFYRIYQDGDSLLWIKDAHKLMCVDLRQEKYRPDLESYFKKKRINELFDDFFMDSQNRMWLLTSDGLLQCDTSEIFSLTGNKGILQDLLTDNNNLYLFYNTGEIICYDLKTKSRLYICAAYPASEQDLFRNTSLVVKGNNGFYQLRNGNKGGFFFFDIQKSTWKKLLETSYTLNTLIIAPNDIAYISCVNGFWKVDMLKDEKEYHPVLKTVDGNVINTEISTLFYDKQGGFWLGTLNRGLLYSHPSRYTFSHIGRSYFPPPYTTDVIVQAFAEDSEGYIYVKCQPNNEIYRYHPDTSDGKVLTRVSMSLLSEDIREKLNSRYNSSFKDTRGWVWSATTDGLKLHKHESKEERVYYTEDGLSNNFIHSILEDRNKNIWVSTSYGISKIHIDSISGTIDFRNFNSYDGTLDGEYSDGAVMEASDGTLYFGGINGFNVLPPAVSNSVRLPYKPVFTNQFLYGERIEVGKEYNGRIILAETAPYTPNIELSYNQNFLTFEFSALNYQNPVQTIYRYQLEGVDDDWQESFPGGISNNGNAAGTFQIIYTNLSPGRYKLKVMASNNERRWDGAVSSLDIIIYAPWWKTQTAYGIYILLLLLGISFVVYAYTHFTNKRIKRQHKEEILLLRIRNLIERCDLLESEKESQPHSTPNVADDITDNLGHQDSVDSAFLAKAIELVEKNINEPNYSVDQLSRDLCMERTGLYRKLVASLDKSPSLFIRSIRLQKAAQMIMQNKFTITEIAERVGFSSASYMSKCFQEMYGCRPSEYVEKMKKK